MNSDTPRATALVTPAALRDGIVASALSAAAFAATAQPFFFGDELFPHRLAIVADHSATGVFEGLGAYKPRLLANAVMAVLAAEGAPRAVHAAILAACMAWILIMILAAVRRLGGGSVLAWGVVAATLTSRYGVMLYFDYFSGLVELLATALFLTTVVLSLETFAAEPSRGRAIATLGCAVGAALAHERYASGIAALGLVIAFLEGLGATARRRRLVIVSSLSLAVVPVMVLWAGSRMFGSLPLDTGTTGRAVTPGVDTLKAALIYAYNAGLGGNHGVDWFWGIYNHSHPTGRILGRVEVALFLLVFAAIVFRGAINRPGLRPAGMLAAAAFALVIVAALPGSSRQEARWMFPVGILWLLFWVAAGRNRWPHTVVALTFVANVVYLGLGSHDSIANVSSSRAARAIATQVLQANPGRHGLIVGRDYENSWTIGGGGVIDMGPPGDTFSQVNFAGRTRLEPFDAGRAYDAATFDFGMVFSGFGPARVPRHRMVAPDVALVVAGALDVGRLSNDPPHLVLGEDGVFSGWTWDGAVPPGAGAVVLKPGRSGFRPVDARSLDGRLLVYVAHRLGSDPTPMRLQINWVDAEGRFLSASIRVVHPEAAAKAFAMLVEAPAGARTGQVYATLHDGATGEVALRSIVLR